MEKTDANYIAIICSTDRSLAWFEKALRQRFSRQISQGWLASALGRRRDKTEGAVEDVVEATPGEILEVLLWAFAGIAFIKGVPDAKAILGNWLREFNPENTQVMAVVASNKETIDSIAKICRRCGYIFMNSVIGKKEKVEEDLPATDHEISPRLKEFKDIEARISELDDKLADAQEKMDVEASEAAVQEMRRLETRRKELTLEKVILIRT